VPLSVGSAVLKHLGEGALLRPIDRQLVGLLDGDVVGGELTLPDSPRPPGGSIVAALGGVGALTGHLDRLGTHSNFAQLGWAAEDVRGMYRTV